MTLFEIFLFIFLLSSLHPSTSVEICSDLCANQLIRFPFRLDNQPDRCGYPRFNLSCRNRTRTVLSLPFSGEFDVVNIDYMFQNIWINDPDYCAPKRLIRGLNLSGTPFDLLYPRSFTFFNCSDTAASTDLPDARYISCLSGTNFSVVAIPADRLDSTTSLLSTSCSEIATVAVPVSWTGWSNLGNGIMLTWNEPNCLVCESRSGSCMFKSDTGLDVGCSGGFDSSGLPRNAKYGIMFGVGIPTLIILGIVIYLRNKSVDDERHPSLPEALSGQIGPRLQAATKGLDGRTIEAYPVILIGESGRLPRPNDNTCPICLSEYQAKETLRTIPDCKHYFHADCIDEWLKLNAVCPLCRITPEKLVPTVSSSL